MGAAVLHDLPVTLGVRPQHIVFAQQRDLVGSIRVQVLHGCYGVPRLGPAELRRLGWFRAGRCCWGGLRGGGEHLHWCGHPAGRRGGAAALLLQGVLAAAGEAPGAGGVARAYSWGQGAC